MIILSSSYKDQSLSLHMFSSAYGDWRYWVLVLQPEVHATEARKLKIVKVARKGCKGRVALVQNRVALVQAILRKPFLQLAKTPFAPFPNHFGGNFERHPIVQHFAR